MTINTLLLITLFATPLSPSHHAVEDVCDVVDPTTGSPSLCEPHPEGAPVYEDVVCCDAQLCYEPTERGCLKGESPYYCERGAVGASGVVTCFFEVPSYCDVFPCEPTIQAQPQESLICCNAGICWNIYDDEANDCELDDIYWCNDGVTNSDGTVTCFD